MEEFTFILLLLAVVAAVTLLAARIGIPYPILMVVAGLGIGLVPGVPRVELDPELVLAVFLPPILFSAAFFLSPRELWRNVRPITLLAVGLVFTTTLAVAAVVMAVAPQIGWPVAITLGAIVSPPDAIAATSIARRLNLPRRLVIIFEGESLVNDATALTIYGLAVAVAVGSSAFDLGDAALSFITVAAGGAVVGLIVGWVASWLLSLLEDPPVEVLISLIVPFTAYLPAERLGVSGVLATVTAGLVLGYRASRVMRSDTRLLGKSTWKMVIFVVNGLAFLLIGLQLPTVISDLESYEPGELVGLGHCGLADRDRRQAGLDLSRHLSPSLAHPIGGPSRPGATGPRSPHPRLGRHARCRLPVRGPGAPADAGPIPRPRPRHLPHLHRDPRDADRPGADPAVAHPVPRGRGRRHGRTRGDPRAGCGHRRGARAPRGAAQRGARAPSADRPAQGALRAPQRAPRPRRWQRAACRKDPTT